MPIKSREHEVRWWWHLLLQFLLLVCTVLLVVVQVTTAYANQRLWWDVFLCQGSVGRLTEIRTTNKFFYFIYLFFLSLPSWEKLLPAWCLLLAFSCGLIVPFALFVWFRMCLIHPQLLANGGFVMDVIWAFIHTFLPRDLKIHMLVLLCYFVFRQQLV